MSEPGGLRLFGRAAAADFRSASPLQLLALVVVCAWLAFEWGPGNELVQPALLMALLNRTPGSEALIIMPVAGFLLGFGLQVVSGFIAAVGFSMLTNTSKAAWTMLQRWRPSSDSRDFMSLGWAGRWGVAFFVGTTAVVLIQLFTTGEAKASKQFRPVMISAALVGVTISAMALVVAIAVSLGRRFPTAEPYVDSTVELLANPLFWLGVLAVGLVVSQLSAWRGSASTDS